MARNAGALPIPVCAASGLKATSPTAAAAMNAMALSVTLSSSALSSASARRSASAHSTMTGASSSAPTPSRSHVGAQSERKFAVSAYPASIRPPTASAAPSIGPGPSATSANFITPVGVSKVLRPSDQNSISAPLMMAASVAPTASTAATRMVPPIVAPVPARKPAASAATKIAGQTRKPRSNTAARAVPAGADGTAGWLADSIVSTFASAKQTTPTMTSSSAYCPRLRALNAAAESCPGLAKRATACPTAFTAGALVFP